jgi:hypothetical protein
MILGGLGDKRETYQAFTRMLTNLFHDLVTNAKLFKKKFLENKKLLQECSQIYPWLGSKFKMQWKKFLKH